MDNTRSAQQPVLTGKTVEIGGLKLHVVQINGDFALVTAAQRIAMVQREMARIEGVLRPGQRAQDN